MKRFGKSTIVANLLLWTLFLSLSVGKHYIVALETERANGNEAVNEAFINEQLISEANDAVDQLFAEQFLTYHTEYFNEGDTLDIQYIGSFYRPDDLNEVSHRVYHVRTARGEPLAFFYARMEDQFITHVGRGESNYSALQNKIIAALTSPLEDLRFTLGGITEVVYVKVVDDEAYKMASVCEPELMQTDFVNRDDILRFHQDCELQYEAWKEEQQAIEEARIPEDEDEGWQVIP